MSRSDQRRRRALRAAAPVAGLLAVGLLVWQGSTAAFSATTDNQSENWATGSLTLTNDGGTGTYAASTTAVFNETALKIPTTVAVSKCVNVKAGGTTGGTLNFYRGAISGTNSATLAPQVALTVKASAVSTTVPTVNTACTGFVSASTLATTTPVGAADDLRHRPRRLSDPDWYAVHHLPVHLHDHEHRHQRRRQRTAVVQRCRGLQLGNPVSLTVN